MGYFANGTEGERYEERYCDHCIHDDGESGCPVMALHYLHNYEESDKPGSFLHVLIPMNDEGENEQCRMFIPQQRGGQAMTPPP